PMAGVNVAGPLGPMPVVAADGRTPFGAYARPFKSNGQPRVALIVGGLGLNAAATKAAIERLPPEITLSFVPYAEGLQGWIDLARANGHEVLLEIPMEPVDYPDNDPGPYTLLADAQPAETVKRLEWLLSRATGYFGVTNYLGQRFVTSDAGMGAFTGALKSRGLAFMDDGSARKRGGAWARASADAIVDDQLSAQAIAAELNALEQAARSRGSALGSGFAYPVTVEVATRWADGLKSRGLQLAPASAVARR
ncbi:divergent polysaccharide deacetylase family protein, partial [Caulobacter sp. 17J65-9]|uniref:divergent polysaccharide deacetylase family protein n=1 Tax=Caulobacter sp. 17J65-9 TaxID=2709382 RepID=UPI0013C87ED7